ncbi:MAG: acetyl-CoA hydrolase/transferase family protein [Dehalococcoidia bacterium]
MSRTTDWRRDYESKLMSADEAAKLVKSGDLVAVPQAGPIAVQAALARRREELSDITIRLTTPPSNPGWFDEGWERTFKMEFELFVGPNARHATDALRASYVPILFSTQFKHVDERPMDYAQYDVALINLSLPNSAGFCNMGVHMWNKRSYIRRSTTVIAEVLPDLQIAHGNTWVHVSEIDAFVQGPSIRSRDVVSQLVDLVEPDKQPTVETLLRTIDPILLMGARAVFQDRLASMTLDELKTALAALQPPAEAKPIADYVAELVRDGDCLQIGTGDPARWIVTLGALDGKNDLGYQSEMAAAGIGRLVAKGVINGSRKQVFKNKAIAAAWSGCDAEELAIIDNNPLFQLEDPAELLRIPMVSSNDNMVSINNAISVDLTGQINAETIFGSRIYNGTGGQPDNHIGAFLSKGGRAITLLPSTAVGGAVSRIVTQLDTGSAVTIPRYFADIIVSEYGVARLLGKSFKDRARELIAIAHPDFRADLRKEASRLF